MHASIEYHYPGLTLEVAEIDSDNPDYPTDYHAHTTDLEGNLVDSRIFSAEEAGIAAIITDEVGRLAQPNDKEVIHDLKSTGAETHFLEDERSAMFTMADYILGPFTVYVYCTQQAPTKTKA